MTSDNGRLSVAFLFALLSLASPHAGHTQTSEGATKSEAVGAAPPEGANSGAAAAAEPAPASQQETPQQTEEKPQDAGQDTAVHDAPPLDSAPQSSAPQDSASQEKPSETPPAVTGATGEPSDDGKTAAEQTTDQKPAEEKPAEEKPVESAAPAPAAIPDQPPAAAPVVETPAEPEEPKDAALTVASPGGGYGQAQERAVFRPFAADTGHKIEVVSNGGGSLKDLEALKNQGAAGGPAWDLVSLDGDLAAKACEEGLLRRLDLAAVFGGEADAAAAREDFVPGAIQPCAIASTVWSTVILFNKPAFAKGAPATVQDLFDTAKFPGKRALPKGGRYVLELALIADGVEPGKVYETLSTDEGVSRALGKLGQLKNDVVWWDHGQEPVKLLTSGKASMAVAFSGQAFAAAAGRRESLGLIWDGQIYHFDLWAIPSGSKHPRTARAFIGYATAPEKLAAHTKWFPYGPARRSALEKVGKHAELDLEMTPYLPTSRDNFKNALAFNGQWWAQHGSSAVERLDGWLKTASIQPPETPAPAAKEASAEKKDEKGKESEKPKSKSKSKPREGSHKSRERNADRNESGSEPEASRDGGRRANRESAREGGREGAREGGRRASRQTERKSRSDGAADGQAQDRNQERNRGSGRWDYPHEYMD